MRSPFSGPTEAIPLLSSFETRGQSTLKQMHLLNKRFRDNAEGEGILFLGWNLPGNLRDYYNCCFKCSLKKSISKMN